MHPIRIAVPVFDGRDTQPPKSTIYVDTDEAKRLVLDGQGELLDGYAQPMALCDAIKTLRCNSHDLLCASPTIARQIEITAEGKQCM